MTDPIFIYSDLIKSFNDLENKIQHQQISQKKGLCCLKGTVPILISAPHAVEQTRNGKIKFSETRTASIASFINSMFGCYSIFKTVNFDDDANYDPTNYYKSFLIDFIKKEKIQLLLDLHIMSPTREYNIDMGTGVGNNISYKYDLIKMIKGSFEKNSIDLVRVDSIFKASYKNTVSATIARENKIPAFQIEMNFKLLDENSQDNKLINILSTFGMIIEQFKEYIK